MIRSDGWRTSQHTWPCSCPCGRPDHLIPADDWHFVCSGVRYCADCARRHVVGSPCVELLAVGVSA